jgi:Fe-S oxidoreductase
VNYNDTDIGKAAVQVLEANNVSIEVPQQKCCGMPYLDGGDIESALRNVQYNLKTLSAYVKSGFDVVTPGPTCTYMLKQEYPMLANSADAKLVAAHTYDIMEYLLKLEKGGKLSKAFERSAGKVIYHLPCHLKAQNIGYKSRDVLELIPNTEVEVVAKCSGHDGTWSLKKEYFELSLDVGAPLFEMLSKADDSQISSDCPLAQLQIEKGVGMKPRHPIQILRDAYGLPKNPEQ